MTEQEFHHHADEALGKLNRALIQASDQHDLEADYNAGALSVEFADPPGRFVVSPNSPVRQIWVSALSRSFKLDWDESRHEFALSGESLQQLVARLASEHLGQAVKF